MNQSTNLNATTRETQNVICETKVEYLWEIESKNSKANTPDISGVSTVKEFEESFDLPTVYIPSIRYPGNIWGIMCKCIPHKKDAVT